MLPVYCLGRRKVDWKEAWEAGKLVRVREGAEGTMREPSSRAVGQRVRLEEGNGR